MSLTLMAEAFKLNYSSPTNNNQRISPNPHNKQIAQPGMNMGQDRQIQMVGGYGENQFRQYAGQNAGNLNGYNAVQNVRNQVAQNPRVQNVGNRNGLIVILGNGNQNQIGNRNLVAAQEYDLMTATADLDEIEEVNANFILMANLQQASTSSTQTDSAPIYDSDGSAELSKEKSTVSFLLEEKKRLKSDFKTCEDELLDKQIQLEKKIKELNNILLKTGQTIHMLSPKPDSVYHTKQKMALDYQNRFYLKQAQKKQQSLYDGKVLLEKHDPPVVHGSEETLQLAQESREKMKQLNKEIKPTNYTKINHLLGVFVPQTAKSHEDLYFSNISKTANVSKSISIPNDNFSDENTPSVARKFLYEVKSTIVIPQSIVKHLMTIKTHNWSSSAHQELHKIVRDEIFPIVNQFDARVQNFKIKFLKEAAKFVGDFKSLAKKADESLTKHKALELEIKRLLKAVVSQDIISVGQNESIVDTSVLQTELECKKERFENYIIKKENGYAKLWNDWYKNRDEWKYDKISYDKAYKDMQQKIKRLQAQLGDLKGKSKDTSCVLDTRNPLSHNLKSENVKLEFRVLNYAKENAHLKATYKNLFDSISVSDQKDNTCDTSVNTKFAKQSIKENLPNINESHALPNLVTSKSVSTPQESKGVNNDKVIAPRMFRINPFKTSREEKHVCNTVIASARTKSVTVSQPPVFIKKDVNSDLNGLSSTRVDNTKTRRP
nr:hypothetical protein [Tanacetum cinerariifolium]